MKTIISILLTALFFVNSLSQELTYTITGRYETQNVAIDSVLVENLSNHTRIKFGPLPVQDHYQITLQRNMQTSVEAIGLDSLGFFVARNSPGYIQISYNRNTEMDVHIEVFNASGQQVYSSGRDYIYPGASINISLGEAGVYFISIRSQGKTEIFKAMGSPLMHENLNVQVIAGNKQNPVAKGTGPGEIFDFQIGDSLRFSVFKKDYFAWPKYLTIVESEAFDVPFKLSTVKTTGISDAYMPIDESTTTVLGYDPSTGRLAMDFAGGEPDLYPGAIITPNLDSTYLLRKVISVTTSGDSTIIITAPAYMNEVFIDKAFKIHTGYLAPKAQLKSTSSAADISNALTDENGYIHPYEVIYKDPEGNIKKSSYLNPYESKGTAGDTVRKRLMYFYENLDATLYKSRNEVVHLFSHDSHMEATLDFCGKFEFDPALGEITEDTKIQRSDIITYDFWLEGNADLIYLLTLIVTDDYKKSPEDSKLLLPLGDYTVRFVIGVVPISITFHNDLFFDYLIEAHAYMEANWGFEYHHELELGASYNSEDNEFSLIKKNEPSLEFHPLEIKGEVHASARAEIYPRIEVLLYDFIGPFFELAPFLDGEFNLAGEFSTFKEDPKDPPNAFVAWDTRFGVGLDFRVGAKMEGFFGLIKKEFGPSEFHLLTGEDGKDSKAIYKAPYYLKRISSIPEEIEKGQSIPLKFKVSNYSVFGRISDMAVPFCPVYFEGDGLFNELNSCMAFTDLNGEVEVQWTPTKDGYNSSDVTIYNAAHEALQMIRQSVTTKADYSGNEGVFTDNRDGESYDWVRIGDQIWMAENLKYIPSGKEFGIVPGSHPDLDKTSPYSETYIYPYYYVYGYEGVNLATAKSFSSFDQYGALYNYKAATEACPASQGWYLPSDGDWNALEDYLADKYNYTQSEDSYYWEDMGHVLKSTTWNGTNLVGFNGTPGGMRDRNSGTFGGLGGGGSWWSSTAYLLDCSYYRKLTWDKNFYRGHMFNQYGISVRCVRRGD